LKEIELEENGRFKMEHRMHTHIEQEEDLKLSERIFIRRLNEY